MPLETDASTDATDRKKIKAAALDYMESWYSGDASRMERALHPELAKRAYLPGSEGTPELSKLTATQLIENVRSGRGKRETDHRAEVQILDIFGHAASVRGRMAAWVDYMHLAKVGDDWKIINVLWELTPERWAERGGKPRRLSDQP